MTHHAAFYEMLSGMADLFEGEQRAGGHDVALEMRAICSKSHTSLPPPHHVLKSDVDAALTADPLPIAETIKHALPLISWHYSGLNDGRIREDIARKMATCELVGPDGMIFHPKIRAGLFMQSAGVDYVTRQHAAVEVFVMLGGSGYWKVYDEPAQKRQAGDIIYHPSMAPHVSVTKEAPLIAAWFWTGDIAYEKYELTG